MVAYAAPLTKMHFSFRSPGPPSPGPEIRALPPRVTRPFSEGVHPFYEGALGPPTGILLWDAFSFLVTRPSLTDSDFSLCSRTRGFRFRAAGPFPLRETLWSDVREGS